MAQLAANRMQLCNTYLATRGGLQQGLPICLPRKIGDKPAIFAFVFSLWKIVPNDFKKGQGSFCHTNQDAANILGRTYFEFGDFFLFQTYGFQDLQIPTF